ncbi:hypothetical protein SDC9_156162 [bioreactor metagenome]|uniref:Uncharacterized protein n=1 Tax=bioreactor metagenome TaxID=1076179 RepID=A0A645F5H6_9ZZZZ
MPHKLPDDTAVPAAYDQRPPRLPYDGHRDVSHHLVVDELVLLRHHYVSVYDEDPAEGLGLYDLYALILALMLEKDLLDPYPEVCAFGLTLNVPEVQFNLLRYGVRGRSPQPRPRAPPRPSSRGCPCASSAYRRISVPGC